MNWDPGWYKDPYFLKRERYWDNGWTDQVRPDAASVPFGVDTRPAVVTPPVVGAALGADAVGRAATDAGRKVHDDDTLAVLTAHRADAPPTATVPALSDDTLVLPAVAANGAANGRQPGTLIEASLSAQTPPPRDSSALQVGGPDAAAAAVRARSRHRRLGYVAAAVILVVLVVVAAVLVTGGTGHESPGDAAHAGSTGAVRSGGGGPVTDANTSEGATASASAADSLAAAAGKSVRKRTVALSFAVTPVDQSESTPQGLSGNGDFALASGLGDLRVTVAKAPTQDIQFVLQGSTAYLHVTDSPVQGKSWVVATTNDLPALGPGSSVSNLVALVGNPGLLVQQLSGNTVAVASLGGSTVDGKEMERYEVSSSSSPTVTSNAGLGTHDTEEVDVGADKLVRQIVIPAPPVDVNGQSVQEDVVISFSHYGTPVSVATPPTNQLLGLSQYLTGLASAADAAAASADAAGSSNSSGG